MDKIEILFKEYDALRAEVLNRTNNLYQLIAVAVLILTWSLSQGMSFELVLCVPIFAGIFMFLAWAAFRDIGISGTRLRELEDEINETAGSELLKWEKHFAPTITANILQRRK
jgi:hypothetical protein